MSIINDLKFHLDSIKIFLFYFYFDKFQMSGRYGIKYIH